MKNIPVLLICLLLQSCIDSIAPGKSVDYKQEVFDTEHRFAQMAADSGIEVAFSRFAAPDAVLKRGTRLIAGRDSIVAFMEAGRQPGVKLTWEPDFADVSASGDLAYTYGRFVYTFPDTAGIIQQQQGIFHTVWKRQPDGRWLFVWD